MNYIKYSIVCILIVIYYIAIFSVIFDLNEEKGIYLITTIKDVLLYLFTLFNLLLPYISLCILYLYYYKTINTYREILLFRYYQIGFGDFGVIVGQPNFKRYEELLVKLDKIHYYFGIYKNLYTSARNKWFFEVNNKDFIIKKLNERIFILNKIKNTSNGYKKLKFASKIKDILWCVQDFTDEEKIDHIINIHNKEIERISGIKILSKKQYYMKYKDELEKKNGHKLAFISHRGVFVDIEPYKLNTMYLYF